MQYRIGIDLGGTAVKSGIVDENHQVVFRHSQPSDHNFDRAVAGLAEAVETVAAMAGLRVSDFPCVGVGIPSTVNPHTKRLVFANNTGWRDVPIGEALEQRLGIPVYIGNDANCAVIGEALAGAAKGRKNVVMLTLGTGVGGGILLDGRLFTGGDGMGVELGHTPLLHGGYRCTCGIEGCLEGYASVTALIRQTRQAMEEHPESALHAYVAEHGGQVDGRTAFDCAQAGDEAAAAVVDQYLEYLANGIGGLITIFRPEIFLLGGGLSAQGENLTRPLSEKVLRYVYSSDLIGVPPIVTATLGNAAGTIGAAYLDRM